MTACKEHANNPVRGYSACAGCEIERLRAELAGLRTGFDAQNEVIAKLQKYGEEFAALAERRREEVEALRKAAKWAVQIHRDPSLSHEIADEGWLDDLELAMGKGGEPKAQHSPTLK